MYTIVQELTKQTNARSQGKSLNITWAGASGFAPFLSAPEASTEDPSPLTAGAFNKPQSHNPSVCNGYAASVRRRSARCRNKNIFSY